MADLITREHGHSGAPVTGKKVRKRRAAAPVTCALPGCSEVIRQLPGGRPRGFCGPDHRAAGRQLGVQEARQAAALAGDHGPWLADAPLPAAAGGKSSTPGMNPLTGEAEPTGARRSRWATGRRVLAEMAVLALVAGIVPAVLLLTGAGSRDTTSRPVAAPGRHTRAPAGQSAQYRLLTLSESWSARAQHALADIQRQLSALSRAQKAIAAVPAGQRSAKADALLRRIRRQISTLARDQASLSTGIAVWGMYQRSALVLAGVRGELGYLRGTQHQARHHGLTSGGSIAGLIRSLASDQKTLTSQVGTWTADLRKTVAQPIATVPTGSAARLASQVREVIPATPVSVRAALPPPASSSPSPLLVTPRPGAVVRSTPGSPRSAPARSAPAGAAPALAGSGPVSIRAPAPASTYASAVASPPASTGRAGHPAYSRLSANPAAHPGSLAAAEAAGRIAIRDESRVLGAAGITVRWRPVSGLTVTRGAARKVPARAHVPVHTHTAPLAAVPTQAGIAPAGRSQAHASSGKHAALPSSSQPASAARADHPGRSSAGRQLIARLLQWIRWEYGLSASSASSGN